MCIKKVEKYQSNDGTIHDTERGAVIRSLEVMLGYEMTRRLVDNLTEATALIRLLNEPRNQLPRAMPPEKAPADEAIDTRTFEDVPLQDEGDLIGNVDVGDLRAGQIVQLTSGWSMLIDAITGDDKRPMIEGSAVSDDGSHHLARMSAPADSVSQVFYQPEDLMDIDAAQSTLAAIEAQEEPLSPLDHKRRILLNRRIELLRSESDD